MAATTLRRWLRCGVAALGLMVAGGVSAQSTPGTAASSSGVAVKSVTPTRSAAASQAVTTSAVPSYTPLESYALLAQSASEGIAVMRSPDRQLVTLRVGTVLAPAKARLVLIQGNTLKFETVDEKGARQIAWVRRGARPEDTVQVERASLEEPPRPRLNQPQTVKQPVELNKNTK